MSREILPSRPPASGKSADAFLAVLVAASKHGFRMTRTKVAKILYLCDLAAVRRQGRQITDLKWRWLHHGPFDNALLRVEDSLLETRRINRITTQNYFGSPEYCLVPTNPPERERSRGLPRRQPGVRRSPVSTRAEAEAGIAHKWTALSERDWSIICDVIEEYGHLAPSSLRDVTYQTRPMLQAQEKGNRGIALDLMTEQSVKALPEMITHFKKTLKKLPRQETDESALEEVVNELDDMAPLRKRATRKLLD